MRSWSILDSVTATKLRRSEMKQVSDTTLMNFIQNYRVDVIQNSEGDMFIASIYTQSSMAKTARQALQSLYYAINGESSDE